MNRDILIPRREDVLAGRVEETKPRPERRDVEFNLMLTAQDGPMWLRAEAKHNGDE